jgi:hypothetical protein
MWIDAKVALLCHDPRQTPRSLEVRGTVIAMTEQEAMRHLDDLCEAYTGKPSYFGGCVAAELRKIERRVLFKIMPTHVAALDARRMKEEAGVTRDSHLSARPAYGPNPRRADDHHARWTAAIQPGLVQF